jgi:hypothetical protein
VEQAAVDRQDAVLAHQETAEVLQPCKRALALAIKWQFDVQFCPRHEYDSKSGVDMTRLDFVREMQKSITDQKRKADQDQSERLHDAEVINKQGLKKWEELHQEVKALSEQIGITFWPLEGYSFKLKNGDAELEVRLEGDIEFSGMALGSFKPVVRGSELVYSLRKKPIGTRSINVTVEQMGQTFTVEEVAERLIRIVVGKT